MQDLRKALYMIVASLLLFILFHFAAPELAIVKLQTPRLAIDFTGFRIGGPLEWSYIFAFCITPVLIMAIHETIRREGGTLSLILALLLMGTLLLSQSKSAYLATFCTLLLYLCFSFLNYRSNKLLITLVTLSACALTYTFITFSDQFAHIWGFIDSLESGQSDASTKARLNQISLIALTVENSILMGYPIIYENIENGFAHYLYFYGLIGLTAYLAFIGSFWFDCYYKCRQFFLMQKGKNMGLHLGILAFATVVPIYALSASPTDSHKGAYFFFSLMAFYAGLIDKNTKVSTRSK
ncbi:hypothetical protein EXT46_14915 [Pseudoalteromonas sp. CO325X]|uniref:hypothetical protein n=1 Tax=Pseudoalteromonas sp. CO325X TaxID=1777262 RepID=UPI0010235403|nr:hypothetical protein [Pseudoalteromonas sp. CO325X]RZF79181.1 hypothetical protein EXT46_14915 [Pseudoalteromonas sp. CO325X]